MRLVEVRASWPNTHVKLKTNVNKLVEPCQMATKLAYPNLVGLPLGILKLHSIKENGLWEGDISRGNKLGPDRCRREYLNDFATWQLIHSLRQHSSAVPLSLDRPHRQQQTCLFTVKTSELWEGAWRVHSYIACTELVLISSQPKCVHSEKHVWRHNDHTGTARILVEWDVIGRDDQSFYLTLKKKV
jgi:hypothetical protein